MTLPGGWNASPAGLMLLAAGLAFFAGLSATPLIDLDEGAFTAATQEMFARGDFLATYLNGQPRHDKPILIYWLQAASAGLFGFTEFALRLPSALLGLAWMGLAYHFARRLYNREVAATAAIVTATTLGIAFVARIATADALLDACIAAAIFFQYLWFRFGQSRDLLLGWLAMACGFLAKGPVALVIPLAVLLLHCASQGRWRDFLVYVTRWRALLLFIAVALPWYVAVTWVKGPAFVETFFFRHNVGRFSGAMGQYHNYGVFYYLPVLLFATQPYTALLFPLARRLKQLWREDDFARYALILFGLVFVLFSASANKLPHYLLYGFSALVVLLARQLPTARSRWHLLPPLLLAVAMLLLPEGLEAARQRANPYYQTMLADLGSYFDTVYYLAFAAFALVMIIFIIERRLAIATKLQVAGLMGVYALAFVFLPALGGVLQQPIKQAGLIARGIDAPLVMYGFNTPSFGVYAQRVVEKRLPLPGEIALTQVDRLRELPAHDLLFRSKHIVLIRVNAP